MGWIVIELTGFRERFGVLEHEKVVIKSEIISNKGKAIRFIICLLGFKDKVSFESKINYQGETLSFWYYT